MATTAQRYQIMDRARLKAMIDQKQKFQLWNTLSKDFYKADANIPGSQWIPVDEVGAKAQGLKIGKDEMIVTYCGGFQCPASKQAAEKLVSMGYTNVYAYEGGLEDWSNAGLPLVKI